MIAVQDANSGNAITSGLSDPDLDFDEVTVVRTGGITQ